ncbi:hypothetical protein MMC28_010212 [Mycoblastus sanguinarius]|nr:hypothetical protein [Mycoblastus sanguinarius]
MGRVMIEVCRVALLVVKVVVYNVVPEVRVVVAVVWGPDADGEDEGVDVEAELVVGVELAAIDGLFGVDGLTVAERVLVELEIGAADGPFVEDETDAAEGNELFVAVAVRVPKAEEGLAATTRVLLDEEELAKAKEVFENIEGPATDDRVLRGEWELVVAERVGLADEDKFAVNEEWGFVDREKLAADEESALIDEEELTPAGGAELVDEE